tara:strand:+ start:870 stop:1079 length:210 start_codon:yes stop_codon:yes gene_type:complete
MSRSDNDDKSLEFWSTSSTGEYVIKKIEFVLDEQEKYKGSKIKLDYLINEIKVIKETLEVIKILTKKKR